MKKTVFLCGPIRGIPRKESFGWRVKATKLLSKKFVAVHALRNREVRETLPNLEIVVARDKNDIINSDIVLVNDCFQKASMLGTSMEVFFAYGLNKTVVLFGSAHEKDYWLNYHSHLRLGNLEEACAFLNKFFA